MTFDFSVLAVYLTPILSALGVFVTAIVKIQAIVKSAREGISTSISDASKQLQDENNYKKLHDEIIMVLQENAELKKKYNQLLEMTMKVKQDEERKNEAIE